MPLSSKSSQSDYLARLRSGKASWAQDTTAGWESKGFSDLPSLSYRAKKRPHLFLFKDPQQGPSNASGNPQGGFWGDYNDFLIHISFICPFKHHYNPCITLRYSDAYKTVTCTQPANSPVNFCELTQVVRAKFSWLHQLRSVPQRFILLCRRLVTKSVHR